MQYQLIDPARYLQGLPQREVLDDSDLDEAEKILLAQAVTIGIYAPVASPASQPAKVKKNVEQPATENRASETS
jgi:hypothetical protein